jgi:large subunit ribosomal protein L25
MADRIKVKLDKRSVIGKKVAKLRREGILPATVYGKGVGPYSVQMDARTFTDMYRRAGRTTLIDLDIPGEKGMSAFVHMLQRHPVTRNIIHVDFRAVDLTTNVTVAIPIHIVGESELVERNDAVLNQAITAIEVTALPTELPSHITVDISGLDSMEKSIHVRDLAPLEHGSFVTDPDELVVSLSPSRPAEEEEAAEAAEEGAVEPELVREEGDEEESEEE